MNQNIARRRSFEAQTLPLLESLFRTALRLAGGEVDAEKVAVQSVVRDYRSSHKCELCPNRRTRLFKNMKQILNIGGGRSAAATETEDPGQPGMDASLAAEPPAVGCEQELLAGITLDDVLSALRDLTADAKLVVLLSLQEGFSYRQIAYIVGSDLETVRGRLHHGRRLLRKGLFDHIDERARQLQNARTGCQEAKHG